MTGASPEKSDGLIETVAVQSTEIPSLRGLIEGSVRGLSQGYYSPTQIESAIRFIFGVDSVLVHDGTYFKAVLGKEVVGCGGWSRRNSLYGGDQRAQGTQALLEPGVDAARIRAFFVAAGSARVGVGSALYQRCLKEALSAGFTAFELGATLPGVPFYKRLGFEPFEETVERLPDGVELPLIKMRKQIA